MTTLFRRTARHLLRTCASVSNTAHLGSLAPHLLWRAALMGREEYKEKIVEFNIDQLGVPLSQHPYRMHSLESAPPYR